MAKQVGANVCFLFVAFWGFKRSELVRLSQEEALGKALQDVGAVLFAWCFRGSNSNGSVKALVVFLVGF